MHLQSLNHLIEAVLAVARPQKVYLLGSASLLVCYPQLGEPGGLLELTADADFLLNPINDAMAETLQIAIGRESTFMVETGYYADILRPTIEETLPAGWESRVSPMAGYDNVWALDCYDLGVVKLMVGREKDLELLRALLRLRILEPQRLRQHFQQTPLGERETFAAGRNLTLLLREFGEG